MTLLDRIILLGYFGLAALSYITVSVRSLTVLAFLFVLAAIYQGASITFWQRKPVA